MRTIKNSLLILLVLFGFFSFQKSIFAQNTPVVKVLAYSQKENYNSKDTISIAAVLQIKENYHINTYRADDPNLIKTTITLNNNDFKILNFYYPEEKLYKFEFSSDKIKVFQGETVVGIKLISIGEVKQGDKKLSFVLNYQACDDRSCLPPEDVPFEVKFSIDDSKPSKTGKFENIFAKIDFNKPSSLESDINLTENPRTDSVTVNQDEQIVSNFMKEKGMLLGLIFIFIGGLALNLTPCIYPLIPITISYFGSQGSGTKGQRILLGIFYALGMSVTYSVLGLIAALTGNVLGSALQNPIVIVFVALVFIALGTSMFGLFEIRIPQKLAIEGNKARTGYLGSFLMGLLVGFIAAPCIGPFVLSLLIYVGTLQNPLLGFLLFFVLSMGLGLPYIFLAASSTMLAKLPRSGEWMEGVKAIFGLVLFGMAINTLEPIFPQGLFKYVFYGFIILAGLYLIFINKKGHNSKIFPKIKITLSLLAIVFSIWALIPSSGGSKVEWKVLTNLDSINISIKNSNKPVIIDFYADWCAQCKELDKYTYTDAGVVSLSTKFNTIKVDLTKKNSEITEKFNIKGLPVVSFINSKGEEIKELRVTGFLKPEEFIKKMKIALEKSK